MFGLSPRKDRLRNTRSGGASWGWFSVRPSSRMRPKPAQSEQSGIRFRTPPETLQKALSCASEPPALSQNRAHPTDQAETADNSAETAGRSLKGRDSEATRHRRANAQHARTDRGKRPTHHTVGLRRTSPQNGGRRAKGPAVRANVELPTPRRGDPRWPPAPRSGHREPRWASGESAPRSCLRSPRRWGLPKA